MTKDKQKDIAFLGGLGIGMVMLLISALVGFFPLVQCYMATWSLFMLYFWVRNYWKRAAFAQNLTMAVGFPMVAFYYLFLVGVK